MLLSEKKKDKGGKKNQVAMDKMEKCKTCSTFREGAAKAPCRLNR